ncbi:MAG: O-antigen ligase family protein [Calditrichaeota bacterium]|nr:O-antigen ligase family protein [Calditrichota bacterium]
MGFDISLVIILGMAGFVAFVAFFVSKPEIVLLISLISISVGPFGSLFYAAAFPLTVFQVFLLVSILFYLLKKLLTNDLSFSIEPNIIYIFLFLLLLLIYTLFSLDKERAFFFLMSLTILAFMTYLVKDLLLESKYYRYFFNITIFIVACLSVYSIIQFIKDPSSLLLNALNTESKVFGRSVSVWTDPNDFAMILVLPLLFIIARVLIFNKNQNNWILSLYVFLFVLLFSTILTTYSRSGWLSFFLGSIFLFILTKNLKKLGLLFFISIILISILSLNEVFYQAIINRVLSITNVSFNVSNTSRIFLAKAGWEMFTDSNFLGYGYFSFPVLAHKYFNPVLSLGVIESHNITLTVLAELGIFGFFTFYSMIFSFFKFGWRLTQTGVDSEVKLYSAVLTSYLFSLLVYYQFYAGCFHNNYMWFIFGALMALKKIDRPENSRIN